MKFVEFTVHGKKLQSMRIILNISHHIVMDHPGHNLISQAPMSTLLSTKITKLLPAL